MGTELVEAGGGELEIADGVGFGGIYAEGDEKGVGVVCGDAREFRAPLGPVIYYFYDPFTRDVMAAVLDNIRQSLAATRGCDRAARHGIDHESVRHHAAGG